MRRSREPIKLRDVDKVLPMPIVQLMLLIDKNIGIFVCIYETNPPNL